MSFQVNKIKQLWFPLAILAIIVLTVGWILAAVVYPNNVQSSDQVLITPDPPTATAVPTEVPTSTPSPIVTATVVTSTPTPTPAANCTYSMHFWRTNSDAWLIENIVLGNLSYTKVEVIAILESEDPSPIERLMGEFFTALLNTLNGADSAEIDSIMVEARDWLILRPHGLDLTEAEIVEIEDLADQLQEYNSGIIGPGLCRDEAVTPTPQEISSTLTPEVTTITPTQEITSTLPATTAPGATIPAPTRTPTKKPGGGGKPKPTNTPPPPQPTNTPPPPPTNTPKPTSTLVPPTLPPPPPTPTQ
jgi:hypothetical protein